MKKSGIEVFFNIIDVVTVRYFTYLTQLEILFSCYVDYWTEWNYPGVIIIHNPTEQLIYNCISQNGTEWVWGHTEKNFCVLLL
jgi:hypothetical protein